MKTRVQTHGQSSGRERDGSPSSGSQVLPASEPVFVTDGRLRVTAAGGLCLFLAANAAEAMPSLSPARAVGLWCAVAVFAASFLLICRHHPLIATVACGAAAIAMQLLAPSGGAFAAAYASVAISGMQLDRVVGRTVAVAITAGFLAAGVFSLHLSPPQVTSDAAGFAFTYLAGATMRRLRMEQRRTQALLEEVLANRDAQIRAAALDERSRLAREIHDVIAHTLSALSVQLEGTRMLLEQRDHDPAAVAAVDRAGRLAREGLEETRRAVGALRGDKLPGPEGLPALAEDFERDSHIPCRLQVEGEPIEHNPEARLAIYRTAQEALTNVRKHADATRVDIMLRYIGGETELVVEDIGSPRKSSMPGGGYGLSGMRERAELLGGTLQAGPTPEGFRVCMRIPQ